MADGTRGADFFGHEKHEGAGWSPRVSRAPMGAMAARSESEKFFANFCGEKSVDAGAWLRRERKRRGLTRRTQRARRREKAFGSHESRKGVPFLASWFLNLKSAAG